MLQPGRKRLGLRQLCHRSGRPATPRQRVARVHRLVLDRLPVVPRARPKIACDRATNNGSRHVGSRMVSCSTH
eukprot:scaffold21193_cov31-Tisochrysis_lutea.AAC.2